MALLLMSAQWAAAQATSTASEGEAPLLVGRVTLFPAFVLKDVGFDDNIGNDPEETREDFTLTAQPRLKAAVPIGSTQLTGAVTVGLVYYATYKDEQSVNRLFEGRFESTAGRLRPFVSGAFNHSRERSGYEIDARVLREESNLSAGASFRMTGVTSLTGFYRRTTLDYGEGETLLDAALASQLDHVTDLASVGLRFAVTPLTTIGVDVETQRDRFDTATIRDTDSLRIAPLVEFAPDAVINGRLTAGFRQFSPRDAIVPEFTGLVAAGNLAYSLLGVTRFAGDLTRDVMYSFDPVTPYYIVTSGKLTINQRVGGPIDVIALAGLDRLEYQGLEGLPPTGRVERTRTFGGGLGIRAGRTLRFAIIYDHAQRESTDLDRRAYQRNRVFGSATYGQ